MPTMLVVKRYKEIDSTNEELKRLVKQGKVNVSDRPFIVAESQVKGKGRYSREWISPKGGLYLSFAQPNLLGKNVFLLNFLSGVIVYDTLASLYGNFGGKLTLKWPNDLYIGEKKVAGILLSSLKDSVITGIGINLDKGVEDTLSSATSVEAETGKVIDFEGCLTAFVNAFSAETGAGLSTAISDFEERAQLSKSQEYEYSSALYKEVGILLDIDKATGHARIKNTKNEIIVLKA